MRTFHTGGIGTRHVVDTEYRTPASAASSSLRDCAEVPVTDDNGNEVLVSLKRNGEVAVLDDKGRELEKYKVPYGAGSSRSSRADTVKKGQILAQWDPHRIPILSRRRPAPCSTSTSRSARR